MSRPSKQLTYKRASVYLTKEMDRAVIELRKTEEYCRCSYAEIIRLMMMEGTQAMKAQIQNKCAKQ